MSLVRLLTSGKCLVALKDSASRYHMRRKDLLPRFGSPRNPFVARPEPANRAPTPTPVEAPAKGAQMTPAEFAAARLKETMQLPAVASKRDSKRGPESGAAAGLFQKIRQFAGKLNPMFWWSNDHASRSTVLPSSARSPAQGELSLDNIKVVRNDLSDADLEVVPARSVAKKKPASVVQAKTNAELAAAQPY